MRYLSLTANEPKVIRVSFVFTFVQSLFKAKFLVFPTWIRGFQVKGTNKALCQEGLILNPLIFCRFCSNENVTMSKLIMHSDAIGTNFRASLGRTGMRKRASFEIFVRHIRTTVRKWEL